MLKEIQQRNELLKANLISQFKSIMIKKICCALILENTKGEILLLKRNSQDLFHPSTWCLPGGGIESGEYPDKAIQRETQEEAGIDSDCYSLSMIDVIKLPDVEIHYFMGCLEPEMTPFIRLNEEEHVQYKWCKKEEWLSMNLILDLKEHLCKFFHINSLSMVPQSMMTEEVLEDMFNKGEIIAIENVDIEKGNSMNMNVTCSNCGWSWKLSDGGLDPMTCHKCGNKIKPTQSENMNLMKSVTYSDNRTGIVQVITNDLEKGGEGSRGGKIIGHTKSGKPIYDISMHPTHKLFSHQDHKDAAVLNSELGDMSHGPSSSDNIMLNNQKHKKLAQEHHELAYEIENKDNKNRMWEPREKYTKFLFGDRD